jgi:hypothetical protein
MGNDSKEQKRSPWQYESTMLFWWELRMDQLLLLLLLNPAH